MAGKMVALAAVTASLLLPSAAEASPHQATGDEVTIEVYRTGRGEELIRCDGTSVAEMADGPRFKISRTEADPDVLVNISVSDPDVSVDTLYNGSGPPSYVAFPPGVESVVVTVWPNDPRVLKPLTMTVEVGDGYEVGSPASATAQVEQGKGKHASCHDLVEQTIPVGGTPALVPLSSMGKNEIVGRLGLYIGGENFEVRGELPPGVTQPTSVDASNEEMTGAATTPGVYEFTTAYCPGDGSFCVLEVPYRVTVVGASAPAQAPGASPVESTPTFTG